MSFAALALIATCWFYVFWKTYFPDLQWLVYIATITYTIVDADTFNWIARTLHPGKLEFVLLYLMIWLLAVQFAGYILVKLLDQLAKIHPEWLTYLIAIAVLAITNNYFLRIQGVYLLVTIFLGLTFAIWSYQLKKIDQRNP